MVYNFRRPVRFGSHAFRRRISNLRTRKVYRPNRRIRRRPRDAIYRVKTPFPPVKYCKLHLNYVGSITSTNGSFGALSNDLKINDLNDPLGAIGAQQARWWDQLTPIYNKYTVYGAKVVAVFSGSEKIGQVAIAGYDASAPSTMLECDERSDCKTRVIDSSTGSKTQIVLKGYYNFPKMVGIPKRKFLTEDDYMTTITSAPGNVIYWQAFFQAYGAQTSSVNVKIHITFYTRMASLQDPADS